MLKTQPLASVLPREIAGKGSWVVVSLNPKLAWPVVAQRHLFRDTEVWIIPLSDEHYPAVAARSVGKAKSIDTELLLMNFVSALCWAEAGGALVAGISVGSGIRPLGRPSNLRVTIRQPFDLSLVPNTADDSATLALALMREGRALEHSGYAFLSFYRALEAVIKDGGKRGKWVDQNLVRLNGHAAREALEALRASGIENIGNHLRDSGRLAIAHGRSRPVINPDDPRDERRMRAELPIVAALAELAIEEVLGIETSRTIRSKHLYELSGFKSHLNESGWWPMQNDDVIPPHLLPNMRVTIEGKEPYAPLAEMQPVATRATPGNLSLLLKSLKGRVVMEVSLAFNEERLEFDIKSGVKFSDDGSSEAALDMAEIARFQLDYYCNGRLIIENANDHKRLSIKDEFLPVNEFVDLEAGRANIARYVELAASRSAHNDRSD